jgi:biopolymer transport protein ExbB/TolQ
MQTLVSAFRYCDLFGKLIVALLVVVSVYVWALMISKHGQLSISGRRDLAFLRRYRQSLHPAQLFVQATNGFVKNVPVAEIYSATMKELLNYLHRNGVTDQAILSWQAGGTGPALPESEMASVRAAAEGALSVQIVGLESRMTFLATSTNVAPSLGLFGTVWGIMRAFMDMVGGGSAIVITAVAPGIASALLTTVAGLFVSIPSAVGYNFLSERVHRQTVDLENFTDELLADIVRIHGASSGPSGHPAAQVVIQSAPAPVAYAPAPAYAAVAPVAAAPAPQAYVPPPVPAPAPAPAPAQQAYVPPPYVPPPAPDLRS